jgi:hypothetical protein
MNVAPTKANAKDERLLADGVMQADHSIGKLFGGEEFQPDGAVAWRDQRNAFADHHGNDMDDELVDLAFVEERRNDARAAHDPDVFSFFRAQACGERFDRFVHEFHACRRGSLRRIVSENVVPDFGIEVRARHASLLIVERHVAGFAAPQNRVNGFVEIAHAVVAFGARPVEPVNAAVGTGDETVGADGDINDDAAVVGHGGTESAEMIAENAGGEKWHGQSRMKTPDGRLFGLAQGRPAVWGRSEER